MEDRAFQVGDRVCLRAAAKVRGTVSSMMRRGTDTTYGDVIIAWDGGDPLSLEYSPELVHMPIIDRIGELA